MTNKTREINRAWQVCFMAAISIALFMLPDFAFAYGVQSTVGSALCGIAADFYGEVGAGIATIAVCTVGTLACVGRVQWTTAIVVAVGIAVLFGATTLVATISGISGSGC